MFTAVSFYLTGYFMSVVSTPIHMDHVGCHGFEEKLIDCGHGKGTRQDEHSEDIAIRCTSSNPPTS